VTSPSGSSTTTPVQGLRAAPRRGGRQPPELRRAAHAREHEGGTQGAITLVGNLPPRDVLAEASPAAVAAACAACSTPSPITPPRRFGAAVAMPPAFPRERACVHRRGAGRSA
jgi:hypothetical protein